MDVKQTLIDAQAAVIGSVLISPEIVGDVMLRVSADDFLTPQYRHVFDAVHEQWAACQAVDVVTVLHRLGDAYRPLLVQIMADTPTAANWEAYADVMREQARLARIKDAAAKMLDAATLDEACAAVEDVLGAGICKNLFLTNRQQTAFYLLLMPGHKPFRTKDLSHQIGSARLSFAAPEHMLELLDITPGSVSVLGLMNDHDGRVRLLIDRDLLKDAYLCCHPCINTSTLKLRMTDAVDVLIPELAHTPTYVDLPVYAQQG